MKTQLSPNGHDRKVYRKLKPSSLVPYRRLWCTDVLDQTAAGKVFVIGDCTTLLYHVAQRCHGYPHHEFTWHENVSFRTHWLSTTYSQDNVGFIMNAWECVKRDRQRREAWIRAVKRQDAQGRPWQPSAAS
ncbi:hypothetical protein HPB49_004503 [Dermacentor silvarum]|uniref:Uncharacterized protein n=1 Tax=Dermacentor silvarum TaxID=543639 RepID=A0ACB8DUV6_DERSI|nr:hypothetical protein HPB49_004503 [Dermacentor silvarum]